MESSNGAKQGLVLLNDLEDFAQNQNLNNNQLTQNQQVVNQQSFVVNQNNGVYELKEYCSHPYICIQYQQCQLDVKFPSCVLHDKVLHIVSSKIRRQQYLMKDPKLLRYFDFTKSGLVEITLSHIMEPNEIKYNLINVRCVTIYRERNDTRIMKLIINQDGANLPVFGHHLVQNMLVATLSNQQRYLNPDLLTDVFFNGRVLVDSDIYKQESKFSTYEMELYNRLNSYYGISQSQLTVNPINNKFQVQFPLIQKNIYSEGRVILKNLLRQFVSEVLVSGYTPQSFYGAIHTEFILLDLEFKTSIPSYNKDIFHPCCHTMQRDVFDDIIEKKLTASLISEIGIVYVDMCQLRVDAQYYNMREGMKIDISQTYVALHQLLISDKPIFMKNPQLDMKILQQYYPEDVVKKLVKRVIDVELFCLGVYQKIDYYAAQQGLKTNHNPTVDLCFMAGMLYQVFLKNIIMPDEPIHNLKQSQTLFYNYLLAQKNKHNFIVGSGRNAEFNKGKNTKKGKKDTKQFNPQTHSKIFVAKDQKQTDSKPTLIVKPISTEEANKLKEQQKEKSHDAAFDKLLDGYNTYTYDEQIQYKKGGQSKLKTKGKIGAFSKKMGRSLKRLQGINLGQLNTIIEQLKANKITNEQFETAAEKIKRDEGTYKICYDWANRVQCKAGCQFKHDYFGNKNPADIEFLDMMCPLNCTKEGCVFSHTLDELIEGENQMKADQCRKVKELIQKQYEKSNKKQIPISLNTNTIDQILNQKQEDLTQDLKSTPKNPPANRTKINIHDQVINDLFTLDEGDDEEEKEPIQDTDVNTNLQKIQRQRQAAKDLNVEYKDKLEEDGQVLWQVQDILDANLENISTLEIFGHSFQVYQFNSKYNCCSILPVLSVLALVDMTFLGYLKRLLKRKYNDELIEELTHLSQYLKGRQDPYYHALAVSLEQVGYKISTSNLTNLFTYFSQVDQWIGNKGAQYNDLLIYYAFLQINCYSSFDETTSIDHWDISKPNPIAYFNTTGISTAHVQLIIPIVGKLQQKEILNQTLPLIKSIATQYGIDLKGAINHKIDDLSVLSELVRNNAIKDQQTIRLKQMILLNLTTGIDLGMDFHYVHNNKNAYTMQIFPVGSYPVYMLTYMDRGDFLRPISSTTIYQNLRLKFPQIAEQKVYKEFSGIDYFKSATNQVYRGAVILNEKQAITMESIDNDQLFPDDVIPSINDYYIVYYCKPTKRKLIPKEVYYTMSLQNTAIVYNLLQQHDHYDEIDDGVHTLLTTGACLINQTPYQLKTTQYYPLFLLQSTQQILQRFFLYLYQNDFSQSVPKTVAIQSIPGISVMLPTPNCHLTYSCMGSKHNETYYSDAVNEFGELYKKKRVQNIMDHMRRDSKDYLIDLDLRRTIDQTSAHYQQTKFRLITYILVNTQFTHINLYDGTILNLQQMSITAPCQGINIQIQPTRLINGRTFKFKQNQARYYDLEIGYNVRLICVQEIQEPQINVLISIPAHIRDYLTNNRESIKQLLDQYYANFPAYKVQTQVGQRQSQQQQQQQPQQQEQQTQEQILEEPDDWEDDQSEVDEQFRQTITAGLIQDISSEEQKTQQISPPTESTYSGNHQQQQAEPRRTYPVDDSLFFGSSRLGIIASQVSSAVNNNIQQARQVVETGNRQLELHNQNRRQQLDSDNNYYGMLDPPGQVRIRDYRVQIAPDQNGAQMEIEELSIQPYQTPFDKTKYNQLKAAMEMFVFTQLNRNASNTQISTLYFQKVAGSDFDDLIKQQLNMEYETIYKEQLKNVVDKISFIQDSQQSALGATIQQPLNITQAQTQELKNRRIEQYNPQLRNKLNILSIILRNLGISLFPGIQSQYLVMNAIICAYQKYLGAQEIQKDNRPTTTTRFSVLNYFIGLVKKIPWMVQQYPSTSTMLSSIVIAMIMRSKVSIPTTAINKNIAKLNPLVTLYQTIFSSQFNLVNAIGYGITSVVFNIAGGFVPVIQGIGALFTPTLSIKSLATVGLSSLCIDATRMALNYQQQLSINNKKLIVTQQDLMKLSKELNWNGQMQQLIHNTREPYICTKITEIPSQRMDLVNGTQLITLRREFVMKNINDIQFSDYVKMWQDGQIVVGAIGGYIQQKEFTPSLHKVYQKQMVNKFFYNNNMKNNPDQILKIMQQEAVQSLYPVSVQHIKDIDNLNPVVIPQATKEQRTLSLLQATVYRKFYQGCVRPSYWYMKTYGPEYKRQATKYAHKLKNRVQQIDPITPQDYIDQLPDPQQRRLYNSV